MKTRREVVLRGRRTRGRRAGGGEESGVKRNTVFVFIVKANAA